MIIKKIVQHTAMLTIAAAVSISASSVYADSVNYIIPFGPGGESDVSARMQQSFYKEKLRTSRSREHREALAELISTEEQKLMFASRNEHFTAEPYINPTISLDPTSPNPIRILFLALFLGLLSGCGIILVRNETVKDS